ncbi:putative membrane-bound spermidine synthase [Acidovorax sp. 56]|uniref:fused MFS/spermidine synthase n=1 Tax=Acidovorax sp. 56 TaxID=2035205 RepID=UPI000C16A92A|nr:fused MFS/spermidine synthase [Acidovorax sp. 56]PIF28025.1 putative membrane-bound spermidine synthase [Acidovorax sp. 56]
MKKLSPERLRTGLLAIFVLSGFAGLIYQSIWTHYLGLFLGHAAYAQALVLAIFMGGMAIGAAWIAHAGQRWRNLIRGYAIIEAVIGVLGLLFHTLFTSVAAFSYDTLIPALGEPWSINLARWLVAAALILPQTILLGMTFPLMSGGLIRRFSGSDGQTLGGLYFTNSIGAAIGALVAVFVLLPTIGLPGAMKVAGVLNFVVAGLAWWLALEPEPEAPVAKVTSTPSDHRLSSNPLLRVVLFSTALSGAASFAYEIIWIRMLSMAVGSTMHAFELMLASFIAGIALGGLWVRKRADQTDSPLRLAGWMQVFMGVAALASLAVYANTFAWVGWLIQGLAKTDAGYGLFNLGTASIAIAIMLPAAFFAGTTLPLFTVALLRNGQGERAIGRVYAWNTLGSIVGVFTAIHLLIPTLGLKLSLCIAALVDMIIGLVLLRMHADSQKHMLRFGMGAALVAVALIIAVRIPFDPMTVASGVFRHGRATLQKADEVVYYRDGKTTSVAAVRSPNGNIQIATNGKTDAAIQMQNDRPAALDEPTMVFLGTLPLAMHSAPERVGVIGFGSGLTTHTLLADPRIKSVDTIEIEPAMIEGARAFGPRVERAYKDPRSHIVIDDAKSYFSGQRSKYDIIISEPSNPWISGVGALFSKEFYEFVPRHLNENGLFVQWIQLYEIDDALVGSILKGLTPAFADYGAWLSNASDLLIVASPKGPLPKVDLASLMANEKVQADLARQGIDHPAQLEFRKIADARILRAIGNIHPEQRVNSDFFPILGLDAPKTRFKSIAADTLLTLPVVNRPLLEALQVGSALPGNTPPPSIQHFTADGLTLRARNIALELRGERQDYSANVLTVQSAMRDCQRPWTENQRRQLAFNLTDLADRTIKYLPPSLLEGVWIKPKWVTCKSMPADMNRALAILEAHSLRDYKSMQLLGEDWINNRPTDNFMARYMDGYAWTGIALNKISKQQWEELPEITNKMEQSSSVSPEFSFFTSITKGLSLEKSSN